MATSATDFEEHISIVRAKLNKDKIKLWLPPFTTEDGEKGEFPMDLLRKFVTELSLPEHEVLEILEQLRIHAVEKLKSRKEFSSTGIATLYLHLQWMNEDGKRSKKNFNVQCHLKENVSVVIEKLLEQFQDLVELDAVKIIHKGVLLKLDQSLESQNVGNSSNLMVIIKQKNGSDQQDEISERIHETKKLAQALASRSDAGKGKHDHFYLEINDQSGKKISLPEEERKSLSLAMTLHEKGRSTLKQKKYLESLLLFLEADQEFSNCRSELLNMVDNYALLCLDIVWCYFKLQKLDHLPDAEEKLCKCKRLFDKSYGPNLERLNFVKGSELNELALFVRVYILEAVCNYLHGFLKKASDCLNMAEEHLKRLQIDDDKFTQLITMGFSEKEARLSLRSCKGDVTMAIEYISRRREEITARENREVEEMKKRKFAKKYGKTASGDVVNIEHVNYLVEMGFEHQLALASIKHANNDINQALEILQENPELLYSSLQSDVVPDHLIQQFVAIGFDKSRVKKILRRTGNDVDKCMEELLKHSESETEESSASASYETEECETETYKSEQEAENIDAQVANTLTDISQEEDDYLDLALDEETDLVNKYRLLVTSATVVIT